MKHGKEDDNANSIDVNYSEADKSPKAVLNSHREMTVEKINTHLTGEALVNGPISSVSVNNDRQVKDDTSKFSHKINWFDTGNKMVPNINYWNKLKDSLFESINKRFHIKEKVKKKELPKVFPLESFRIGRFSSYFHLKDQLFVIIENDKYVFFLIYRDIVQKDDNKSPFSGNLFGIKINFDYQGLYHRSKRTLKNALFLSNHLALESNDDCPGYFGAIAYEVYYNQLHGMEFTNSLLNDS